VCLKIGPDRIIARTRVDPFDHSNARRKLLLEFQDLVLAGITAQLQLDSTHINKLWLRGVQIFDQFATLMLDAEMTADANFGVKCFELREELLRWSEAVLEREHSRTGSRVDWHVDMQRGLWLACCADMSIEFLQTPTLRTKVPEDTLPNTIFPEHRTAHVAWCM
jgi:hypothetical protein